MADIPLVAPAPSGANGGGFLAEAGWNRLADRLVAGSCHDLNGRSSALYGLAELARAGDDADFIAEALSTEARRIQNMAVALQVLSSRSSDEAQILALADRLPSIVSLFSIQPGAELLRVEVTTQPDVPAIRVPWRALSRATLLVMNVVAANVLAKGGRGELRVIHGGDADGPFLRVQGARTSEGETLDPAARELVDHFREWPPQLAWAIEEFGGGISFEPGDPNEAGAGPRAEVRLPSASA